MVDLPGISKGKGKGKVTDTSAQATVATDESTATAAVAGSTANSDTGADAGADADAGIKTTKQDPNAMATASNGSNGSGGTDSTASTKYTNLRGRKWTQPFHDFVKFILVKDPKTRPGAEDCTVSPFVSEDIMYVHSCSWLCASLGWYSRSVVIAVGMSHATGGISMLALGLDWEACKSALENASMGVLATHYISTSTSVSAIGMGF